MATAAIYLATVTNTLNSLSNNPTVISKNLLPKVILLTSPEFQALAQEITDLAPTIDKRQTNNKNQLVNRMRRSDKTPNVTCPSNNYEMVNLNKAYELIDSKILVHRLFLLETRCDYEGRACCNEDTKCQTVEEQKTYVTLQIKNGKAKAIKKIERRVGVCCKCLCSKA